jgi:hypothetical protein
MGNDRKPGIDIDQIQDIVDGTMCLDESPLPGPSGLLPWTHPISAAEFVYCDVWDASQRRAFLTGFIRRLEEYGDDVEDLINWILDAVGLGDSEGDFSEAWSRFGDAIGDLAELAWKVTVVAGIPFYMVWHPKREEYRQELLELGIALTEGIIEGYKKAYEQGGVPQCMGRLYADILVLFVEALATKGAGKVLKSIKLERFVPAKLRNKFDETATLAARYQQFIRRLPIAMPKDAGMPSAHFSRFQIVARAPLDRRIILVRKTGLGTNNSTQWIDKGYPPKIKELEFVNTAGKNGFVTCDEEVIKRARNTVAPNGQKYFVVEKDLKSMVDGDGKKIHFLHPEKNEWPLEAGQIIDPKTGKPLVGDYDLQDVIDPDAKRRVISTAIENGQPVKNFTNTDVKRVADKLNAGFDQPRVLHGHDFFYKDPVKKLEDLLKTNASKAAAERIIAFFPDGKPRVMTLQDLIEYYKLTGRQSPNLHELK